VVRELVKQYRLVDILAVVKDLKKSTYCYWNRKLNEEHPDQELESLIQSIYDEHNGNYGYRRIEAELRNQGHVVNHKKVLRIMRERGILCTKYTRKSRKYRAYKGNVGSIAKNRIRRCFSTPIPLQKVSTDITEFKCRDGKKLYLSPFLDMFNGEIIAFAMNDRPSLDLVLQPLESALDRLQDAKYRTTIHSDQGWHYQHAKWCKKLRKHKIFQSMSRKGNCLDNSPMENFFGLLKQEIYYGVPSRTYEELHEAITNYIHYYNNKRIKQKLAGMSPVQYRIHSNQLAA
jgi:putative transposase